MINWQLILNAIIDSCLYLIIANGIAIIYNTTKYLNFALGVIFTFGAYIFYLFFSIFGMFFYLSVLIAVVFGVFISILYEFIINFPLRKKKASPVILILTSLGIYIILQNFVSLLFGEESKIITFALANESIQCGTFHISIVNLSVILISFIVTSLSILFYHSQTGIKIKAITNNFELAYTEGINVFYSILISEIIGAILIGMSGILFACNHYISPPMGLNFLLIGSVIVIIGGTKNIYGIILAALLLGFAQNFAAWYLPSQWQDAIAFAIMLIFLLFRPQGFFGKPLKKAEV